MDSQTMNLNFSQADDSDKIRSLLQRMGQFIALYEASEEKLRQREAMLQERIGAHEIYVNEQLERIHLALGEFDKLMSEAGVARWRLAAEDCLQQGKAHLQLLKSTTAEFSQLSQDTCERLDRATSYTIKGIADAISSFRLADFKQLTDDGCQRVEKVAAHAIRNIAKVTRWFYWKKIILVCVFSMMVATITGLYINGEWPWEDHKDILRERELGKAAMQAWSDLNPHDQQAILHKIKTRMP
jgi:hypothetical protein